MEPEKPGRATPSTWSRVSAIFGEVMEAPPAQRQARVEELCGSDEEVRREVSSLLEAHDAAGDFAESPSPLVSEWAGAIARASSYDRLGPYQLLEEIGQGGMGTVYRARRADEEFHREVAIKVVSRGMNTDFVLRRFRSERQILADLTHPNITTLLDGGTTPDGLPYLVMEFVSGEPITTHCDGRKLDLRARLALFHKVCLALEYAHQKRVIHRDLKPSNILVTSEEIPKLLDFGIARILDPGSDTESATTMITHRLLTPQYASPEQFRGEKASEAGDIYSLGVILWELVTGERPYRLSAGASEEDPEQPGVTASRSGKPWGINRELESVLRKAVRKEPSERYNPYGN